MLLTRSSGILLHPTSLPGPEGIGTLGAETSWFLDTLHRAGVGWWQVLPLHPTGYADSPYAALSAFAGNPMLLSLEQLRAEGWLDRADVPAADGDSRRIDFGQINRQKMGALRTAYIRQSRLGLPATFGAFCRAEAAWLDDFALFMTAKEKHGGRPWWEWDSALRKRDERGMRSIRKEHGDDLRFHCWLQWHFIQQWRRVRADARRLGVRLLGDCPIFVAHDSADVWARQEIFQLDNHGMPTVVAGVPPDYFSETGQRWGNPHYRWDRLAARGYDWWIDRLRCLFRLVDMVRLDHFRGFVAAWTIPVDCSTAVDGEWVPGPGRDLFRALRAALGDVPLLAEDLGIITPDVDEVRRSLGYPGMKVLQFAFSTDARNDNLPHHFERSCAVYTGTHDNDTALGWFDGLSPTEQTWTLRYLHATGADLHWDLIRLAFASVATLAVIPLQDVLGLGSEARMNLPGRTDGNWAWRFADGDIQIDHTTRLRDVAQTYGRLA